MRLFLLPISTRRTLLYCERVQEQLAPGTKAPLADRATNYATSTWAAWERAESGWKKKVTVYGNQLFKRIPYEEWGLKTIPPATAKRLKQIDDGKLKVECQYPGAFMDGNKVTDVLKRLATERQALHSKRMWQCILIAPLTAPFALVPVIPNLPFFYLVFRAWSHYRALYGGKLLERLLSKSLVKATSSQEMNEMYTAGLLHPTRAESRAAPRPTLKETERVATVIESQTNGGKEDVMVLQRWNGKLIAEAFKLPEMEVEIERAVEQVEKAIKGADELAEEKQELVDSKTHHVAEQEEGKKP